MNDPLQLRAEFRRYAQLIAARLAGAPRAFAPVAESATALQVERGIVLPAAMVESPAPDGAAAAAGVADEAIKRVLEIGLSDRLASTAVVDAAGHHRPIYRPLLIYASLLAFHLRYETLPRESFGRWEEGLRGWADLLEAELVRIVVSDAANPAVRGASVAEAAWTALALHLAGKEFVRDAWTDLASDTFGRLCRAQQQNGPFLFAAPSDSPELFWYHELAILHATASYAAQAEERSVARSVARATKYHLDEIQPDHATAQPWALFAFLWNPPARPLADQILHATSLGGTSDGVALILLADALYCLRLFLDESTA